MHKESSQLVTLERPFNKDETTVDLILRISFKWKIQFLLYPLIKRKLKAKAKSVINDLMAAIDEQRELIDRELIQVSDTSPVVESV